MTAHPTEPYSAGALAQFGPEHARTHMLMLLLANPNYFGTAPNSGLDPVLTIAGDTAFEQLGCVGYNPTLGRLEAVVAINQDSGYNGGLCTAGSQEYVRFYTSPDKRRDLAGPGRGELHGERSVRAEAVAVQRRTAGQPARILVRDRQFAAGARNPVVERRAARKHAEFHPGLGQRGEHRERSRCRHRASSSSAACWNTPTWRCLPMSQISSTPPQAVPVAPPKTLTPAELAALYPPGVVPAHRQFYKLVTQVSGAPAKHPLTKLGLNIGAIVAGVIATSGDTAFEQLDCVGLDTNRSLLAAVVQIKQSSGYNGGPCTAGSSEYVAFWVDWGTGFEYVGTTSFTAPRSGGDPAWRHRLRGVLSGRSGQPRAALQRRPADRNRARHPVVGRPAALHQPGLRAGLGQPARCNRADPAR